MRGLVTLHEKIKEKKEAKVLAIGEAATPFLLVK